MKSFLAVLILALSSVAGAAQNSPQYLACGKAANTQVEMNQCATDEAKLNDANLDRVYTKLLSVVSGNPEVAAKVKAVQRAWLLYRDAYLAAMYPAKDKQAEYGSIYPMEAALVRAELTQRQIEELADLATHYESR
jgi:uncharacterized protein YecT (DUF1311 family)